MLPNLLIAAACVGTVSEPGRAAPIGEPERPPAAPVAPAASPALEQRAAIMLDALARLRLAEWLDPAITGPDAAIVGRAVTPEADGAAWGTGGEGGRAIVLVHGVDDDYIMWDELAPALMHAGYAVLRFDFPHRQGIDHSADMLGESLTALRTLGVTKVDLVCHSLGGLVSRDLLTRRAWYAGKAEGSEKNASVLPTVERLIMIATPNHGAPMAHLLPARHAMFSTRGWFGGPKVSPAPENHEHAAGPLSPRGGDAAADLLPGSEFLRDLNNRDTGLGHGLPAGVAITNIVPTVVPRRCQQWVKDAVDAPRVRDALGERASERVASYFDDAVDTIGDVLVPRNRAELAGVADTVYVDADHRSVVNRWGITDAFDKIAGKEPKPAPAIPIVLDRLARETN